MLAHAVVTLAGIACVTISLFAFKKRNAALPGTRSGLGGVIGGFLAGGIIFILIGLGVLPMK